MIKKQHLLAIVFILSLVAGSAVALRFIPREITDEKADILVTSYPLFDLTRRVVPQTLTVSTILPPGGNPHTFDPTPSTARQITNAKIVFAIGHGFDDWIDPLLQNTKSKKVVVDTNITLRENKAEDKHDEHAEDGDDEHDEHGPIDPHYWLSALNAKIIASNIAVAVMNQFPEHSNEIEQNLHDLHTELDAVHSEVFALLQHIPNKNIITLHDAWYYFADAYGLTIVGTFEPSVAREPTPKHLIDLSELAKKTNTKTIYGEPGASQLKIASFAKDLELYIAEIDPMEGTAKQSYTSLLRTNAETIKANQK